MSFGFSNSRNKLLIYFLQKDSFIEISKKNSECSLLDAHVTIFICYVSSAKRFDSMKHFYFFLQLHSYTKTEKTSILTMKFCFHTIFIIFQINEVILFCIKFLENNFWKIQRKIMQNFTKLFKWLV